MHGICTFAPKVHPLAVDIEVTEAMYHNVLFLLEDPAIKQILAPCIGSLWIAWCILTKVLGVAIYKWRQQARKEGYIEVWENAEHIKRDWTWVGDVCRLHTDFMQTVVGSGIWNCGAGLAHSFLDIAETIAEQEGVEIRTIPVPDSEKTRWRQNTCANLKHLKELSLIHI